MKEPRIRHPISGLTIFFCGGFFRPYRGVDLTGIAIDGCKTDQPGRELVLLAGGTDTHCEAIADHDLPAGSTATPVTYTGSDGRQYLVFAAGGHSGLKTTPAIISSPTLY